MKHITRRHYIYNQNNKNLLKTEIWFFITNVRRNLRKERIFKNPKNNKETEKVQKRPYISGSGAERATLTGLISSAVITLKIQSSAAHFSSVEFFRRMKNPKKERASSCRRRRLKRRGVHTPRGAWGGWVRGGEGGLLRGRRTHQRGLAPALGKWAVCSEPRRIMSVPFDDRRQK